MMTKKMIEGKFYPLNVDEIIYLGSILTDTELKTLLYLKAFHPFTDTYKEIDTAQMAEHLNISRRSVQRFLKKFKELNLIDYELTRFKYKATAGSPKRQQDRQSDSRIAKATLGSPKRQQDRCQSPEPLPDKDSTSLQTLQTFQTPQTGGEEEKTFFSSEEEETAKENKLTNLKDELLNLNEEKLDNNNSGEDQFSAQPAANRLKSNPQVKEEADRKINEELEEQLRSLEIPLDQVVRKCIEKHHISQVQKAIAHIENTWEDIRNPRSVFLYQVPKQTVEKPLKNPLTPEFLDWYSGAIAQGIVVDRPPKTLPLNHFREPMVILPDGRQMDWQRVRDGDAQPLLPVSELGEFWAGIRAQLVKRIK